MKKIKLIEIEGASFFKHPLRIQFSEKLNCIMGGRGTGKSTLLHMILSSLDSNAEFDKTTYSILKNNLGEGKIFITVEDEQGKNYKIIKTFNEDPQPYLLPDETFMPIDNIKNNIECDIYKAAEIEEIGMNGENRIALIDKMLSSEVKTLMGEIEKKQIELEHNAHLLKMENSKIKQLEEKIKDYENAESDLATHKKEQPADIIPEEKAQFETADKNEKLRFAEKRFIENIILEIQDFMRNSDEQAKRIQHLLVDADIEFSNKEIIKSFIAETKIYKEKIIEAMQNGDKAAGIICEKAKQFLSNLNRIHQKQQNEFVNLKQKFEKHKIYYAQYNKLSKRVNDKGVLQKELNGLKDNRGKLKKQRMELIGVFNKDKKELFNKRSEKIQELNKGFGGAIKITLTFSGITHEYEVALQKAFRGSGMRYNVIIPNIIMNFTPDKFAQVIHSRDFDSLKNIAAIDKERSEAIFNLLCDSDSIFDIEKIYCPDLPEFLLKIDKKDSDDIERENYKRTEELSTGQRCTTILPIIFAVSKNPLIIDQPEDNLDNQYITKTIHRIIREEKQLRQLIFITHNPNIPVLSDAEHNLFLVYEDKKASVEKEGTVESVKDNILNLLEGGREAFNIRKTIYGV